MNLVADLLLYLRTVILLPGKRQPIAVLEANGRKHLSKKEIAERQKMEVSAPVPNVIIPPKWLSKKHHKEFLEIAELLKSIGLYTELDRDCLGQYLVAKEKWRATDKKVSAAMREANEKNVQIWTNIQNTYFRQVRQCAESLGLTVTSRCRLVVPERNRQATEDNNPFLEVIRGGKASYG